MAKLALEKGRIGNWQLYLIVLFITLPTAVLAVPAVTTGIAKQNGWLATVIATGFGLVIALIIGLYYKIFPDKNLVEVSSFAFGKWPGSLIGLSYVWFFLHINASIIREFGEFLTIAVMPETPLSVFTITIVLLAAWAVSQGLEVIGRMCEFVFPLAIAATLFLVLLASGEANFTNIGPVLLMDWKKWLAGSFIPNAWMGEIVLLSMVVPFVYRPQKSQWWIAGGVLTVGFILVIITLAVTLVFGYEEAGRLIFPTFSLARIISIGDFIERMESLVMAIWVAGVFLKITIWYYMLVLVTAQVFGLKSYKPLIIPYGFTQLVLSFWVYDNFPQFIRFISTTWPVYGIGVFELGLPSIILLTAVVRKYLGNSA